MYDVEELKHNLVSRRAFLARMSAAGLGAAAVTLLAGCGNGTASTGPNAGPTVLDSTNFPTITGRSENEVVLNYALTLETLEADLYRQALNKASGRALTTALDSTVPTGTSTGNYTQTVGNGSVSSTFSAAGFLYLVQFAYVEAAHRDFLKAAISAGGGTPTTGNAKGYQFPGGSPGADLGAILTNILPLEETGVRAYLGALPFLTDNTLAQTAGTIYSTEARHSAAIEYILGNDPGPTPRTGDLSVATAAHSNDFEYYLKPATVINTVASTYFIA